MSVYDRTKWQAHYEVALPMMAAGLPLVIVQPGVVYGPGDTSAPARRVRRHLRRRLPLVPARTAFCWGHIEDTARAHVDAMEHGRPGQSYIIAGPAHTLRDARAHRGRLQRPRRAAGLAVPPAMLKGGRCRVMRVVEAVVTLPPALSSETLRVLAGTTYLGRQRQGAPRARASRRGRSRRGCGTSSSTRCGCSA